MCWTSSVALTIYNNNRAGHVHIPKFKVLNISSNCASAFTLLCLAMTCNCKQGQFAPDLIQIKSQHHTKIESRMVFIISGSQSRAPPAEPKKTPNNQNDSNIHST